MKTVGEIAREARIEKRYSLSKVEEITKIKKEFVEAIERGQWSNLPDFPVVLGFVKSIAECLDISPERMVALLKRDYPPKVLPINPKPDISRKFNWSPKLTFLLGVSIMTVLLLSYLAAQYVRFVSPPKVDLIEPKEGEVITTNNIKFLGKTDPDATIKVNNQPFLVNDEGIFQGEIQVTENTDQISVIAVTRSGKETVINRKIKVEVKK